MAKMPSAPLHGGLARSGQTMTTGKFCRSTSDLPGQLLTTSVQGGRFEAENGQIDEIVKNSQKSGDWKFL